jgi:hypothetical protein
MNEAQKITNIAENDGTAQLDSTFLINADEIRRNAAGLTLTDSVTTGTRP